MLFERVQRRRRASTIHPPREGQPGQAGRGRAGKRREQIPLQAASCLMIFGGGRGREREGSAAKCTNKAKAQPGEYHAATTHHTHPGSMGGGEKEVVKEGRKR